MAFVDGDHTYDGVVADLAELSTFLRPNIPVVFHDYLNSGTPGVAKAVDEWCKSGFARRVRTFGCSAEVRTTAKCSGRRGLRFSDLAFRAARGEIPPGPYSLKEMIALKMPWLVPIVRKMRGA